MRQFSRCMNIFLLKLNLSEIGQIKILMMIGYEDLTAISKATIAKIMKRFVEIGSVSDRPKISRPKTIKNI